MTDRSPDPDRTRLSRRGVLAAAAAGVGSPALARGAARSDRTGEATVAAAGYGTGGYGVGGYGGAQSAGPGDVTGSGTAATDPDADGTYEDVTGDGGVDILDVAELLEET